jgi:membrane protease YdiL (CAAX protease family)
MLPRALSVLFILFLVVGVPILSLSTARDSQIRQMPRLALYISAAISQWALAGLGLLVFFLGPLSSFSIGFRTLAPGVALASAGVLVALAVAGLGLGLFLESRGWWPAEAELVYLLIPTTRYEKLWSVLLLAPTAALCEEFLYRGFLLAQLTQWLRSGVWAWAASSLFFGLAHVYQGWHGMVRASLLGALLAYPVIHLGSLYPSMLAHGLIDALALAWLGPKYLAGNREDGIGSRAKG